jgi:hypothetical protein
MQDLKSIREEFEGNEKEENKVAEAKKNEAGIDDVIQALVDAKPSDDNAEQGKFVSLMKGLAFSDDPKATAFMKKLMGAIDSSFAGGKANEEKDNIMKISAGLHKDSTDEEIEAVAKKSGHDAKAIKKIVASKEKVEEGLSGAELEKAMKKAHPSQMLDMMSDAIDGSDDAEDEFGIKKGKEVSKFLSKASDDLAKLDK